MKFTDLVMCAGDDAQTELHCHRAALAKSSEVFDRMLSTMAREPNAQLMGISWGLLGVWDQPTVGDIMGITGSVGLIN